MADESCIAREANAANNAMHQQIRFDRWAVVRDALWNVLDPLCRDDARVAIVGAGSGDDVPLQRIAHRAAHVDLFDFDEAAVARARARVAADLRARVRPVVEDVLAGAPDLVLRAVRDKQPLPDALPLPYGPLGDGDYDLVVGDMLYTQLLHAGLLALDVRGERQHELMRRYDPPLANALVQRIQASLAPGGHAVHVHDLACWSTGHDQPLTIDEVLADPDSLWTRLHRHDACDPHLVLDRLGVKIASAAYWRWPFEPRKHFLVRATVARAHVGAGTSCPALLGL